MKSSHATYFAVNLCYLAFCVFIVVESAKLTGEGRIVPLVIGIPTIGMLAVALWARLRTVPRHGTRSALEDEGKSLGDVASWPAAITVVGWIGGLFLLILFVGFDISIPVYTFLYLIVRGRVSWVRSFLVAGSLWLLIYVSFDLILNNSLFSGIFFGDVLPLL